MDYLANISAFENLANNQNSMIFNDYTDGEYIEKATQPRSWVKRHPIMTTLGGLGLSGALLAGLLRSANGTNRVPLVPNKYQPAATSAVQRITTGVNAVPITKYNDLRKLLGDTTKELEQKRAELENGEFANGQEKAALQAEIQALQVKEANLTRRLAALEEDNNTKQQSISDLQQQLDEAGADRDSWRLKAVVGDPDDSNL